MKKFILIQLFLEGELMYIKILKNQYYKLYVLLITSK